MTSRCYSYFLAMLMWLSCGHTMGLRSLGKITTTATRAMAPFSASFHTTPKIMASSICLRCEPMIGPKIKLFDYEAAFRNLCKMHEETFVTPKKLAECLLKGNPELAGYENFSKALKEFHVALFEVRLKSPENIESNAFRSLDTAIIRLAALLRRGDCPQKAWSVDETMEILKVIPPEFWPEFELDLALFARRVEEMKEDCKEQSPFTDKAFFMSLFYIVKAQLQLDSGMFLEETWEVFREKYDLQKMLNNFEEVIYENNFAPWGAVLTLFLKDENKSIVSKIDKLLADKELKAKDGLLLFKALFLAEKHIMCEDYS